jgi:predicted phosphodiesterase
MVAVLGDVAAGPMPAETLDRLMTLRHPAVFVRGNADREVVDAWNRREAGEPPKEDQPWEVTATWVAGRITVRQRDFVAGFPPAARADVPGLGRVLFCHGSPRRDDEIVTRLTPDERVREVLAGVREDVVIGGHTHQQVDRRVDGWRLLNAGSVGVPYEGDPDARWAVLGGDQGVELRRTPYDIEAAVEEIRRTGCPVAEDWMVATLLRPPDPDEVSAMFERRALEEAAAEAAGERPS